MNKKEFDKVMKSKRIKKNHRECFELRDIIFEFDEEHEYTKVSGEIDAQWAQKIWEETEGKVVASIVGIELPYHGIPNSFYTHRDIKQLHYNVKEYCANHGAHEVSDCVWKEIDSHIVWMIEQYQKGKGLYVEELFVTRIDDLIRIISDIRQNKLKVTK